MEKIRRRLCRIATLGSELMPTFAEFLVEAARKGEAVNIMFEERLFPLVGILDRLRGPPIRSTRY